MNAAATLSLVVPQRLSCPLGQQTFSDLSAHEDRVAEISGDVRPLVDQFRLVTFKKCPDFRPHHLAVIQFALGNLQLQCPDCVEHFTHAEKCQQFRALQVHPDPI